MSRRVVVTGMGVVSSIGSTLAQFQESLFSGKSGIKKVTLFNISDYPTQIAGEISDFDVTRYGVNPKEARRMDRVTQLAIAASTLAFNDAGLDARQFDHDRTGVYIGSGVGGIKTLEDQVRVLAGRGNSRVNPFLIPMMIANMPSGHVAIHLKLRGPNYAQVSACSSSAHSIGQAFREIKYGYVDMMLAGGAEAPIVPIAFSGFCNMKALSSRNNPPEKASSPFDVKRDGFVMSEGAAVLILEELEYAINNGSNIYAEIVGAGYSCDGFHITAPDETGSGGVRAMKAAMDEAGIAEEDVDYINAHGTATQLNDKIETMVIKKVLGDSAKSVSISSTKSMTGHLLGAAGAIEIIACISAINRSVIPPTINLDDPDPACDLNYTPNICIDKEVNVCLSNSLGFGGHNATLAVKKYT
ncbi:MAG: beta-ketoacyl-ACP synthase II [bacterium]